MLEFHPVANIFPMMTEDEYRALVADIAAHGQREAIWTYQGKIIDGRNRYKACAELGLKPVMREWDGEGSLIEFVVSMNLHRRHLSSHQKAAIALDVLPMLEAEARERQIALAGTRRDLDQKIDQGRAPQATEQAARLLGTNRQYVSDAKKLAVEAPDLLDKVRAGTMTIPEAKREVRRETLINHLEAVETQEAKAISGVYDVIVIDPPWPMRKIERDERPNQSEFDYPTMTEDELACLEIPGASDCHVWVWTTHKFLPMALRLLERWGLRYVCAFVWHKPGGFQPYGLPQFNCEFAIYAHKGAPQFFDTKAFNTCFEAPRGAHSEKPEAFYETVRRVTAGRRLDMFGRRAIAGFDSWGKESPHA